MQAVLSFLRYFALSHYKPFKKENNNYLKKKIIFTICWILTRNTIWDCIIAIVTGIV